MTHETKRVPLDFSADWVSGDTWEGFINPFHIHKIPCKICGETGWNAEMQELVSTFYIWDPVNRTDLGWGSNLTSEEILFLFKERRIPFQGQDIGYNEETSTWWKASRVSGITVRQDIEPPILEVEDVVEINTRLSCGGLMHDGINRHMLFQHRGNRLGVYGGCSACDGDGHTWPTLGHKEAYDNWEAPDEPPVGEGWQMWQTISDAPMSPVFETESLLRKWSRTFFSRGDFYENRDCVWGLPW